MVETSVTTSTKHINPDNHDAYQTTQYVTTIPKQLAEADGLGGGETVEWTIQDGILTGRIIHE